MHFQTSLLSALAVFTTAVFAQEIDTDDIPVECRAICAPARSITASCDTQFNDDDAGQLNCVCTAEMAYSFIPTCEACVAQFDNDGADNDVNDIISSCSFARASYTGGAVTATPTPSSVLTTATTTPPTGTSSLVSVTSLVRDQASMTSAAAAATGAAGSFSIPVAEGVAAVLFGVAAWL